jgi:hypothetical protein
MQQLPPAICTAPLKIPGAVVEVSCNVTAVGECAGPVAGASRRDGAQETVISTNMENKISVLIFVSLVERFAHLRSSDVGGLISKLGEGLRDIVLAEVPR